MRRQTEALVEAVNARDFDAVAELAHPELEFRSVLAAAEGEVYTGVEGIRQWARNVDEAWSGFRVDLADFRAAGRDRALVVLRVMGEGRGSGVPLDSRRGQVWTWRDGRVWLNVAYAHEREAFEAVGVPYPG